MSTMMDKIGISHMPMAQDYFDRIRWRARFDNDDIHEIVKRNRNALVGLEGKLHLPGEQINDRPGFVEDVTAGPTGLEVLFRCVDKNWQPLNRYGGWSCAYRPLNQVALVQMRRLTSDD